MACVIQTLLFLSQIDEMTFSFLGTNLPWLGSWLASLLKQPCFHSNITLVNVTESELDEIVTHLILTICFPTL